LEQGEIDATLLAVAGLKRLGLLHVATSLLSLDDFIPAVAQGAIGIQCRENDQEMIERLAPLNHVPTFQAVTAERGFMKAMHGSCRTPIAAYATIEGEILSLRGMKSDPEGKNMRFVSHQGPVSQAAEIGREAAQHLREGA
jgi:hydroxymethylbilane synthase